ncbi:hypothetical protein R6Q59_006149 [Mikania micrantha]
MHLLCTVDDHAADDEYAEKLKKESLAFFFLSTYGDGEPAGNAARFYEWFTEGDAKGEWLNKLQFGVFGLANRQYEHFNMIAKVVDDGLADQGMPSLLHINFSIKCKPRIHLSEKQKKKGHFHNFISDTNRSSYPNQPWLTYIPIYELNHLNRQYPNSSGQFCRHRSFFLVVVFDVTGYKSTFIILELLIQQTLKVFQSKKDSRVRMRFIRIYRANIQWRLIERHVSPRSSTPRRFLEL